MSEEAVPPSDEEDIFLSTQIQGKLDDLENEAKQKSDASNLLQKFALKPLDSITVNTSTSVKSSKGRKEVKARPSKPKPKKKNKKLSVTDQMIRKLSGKPQKLRQTHLKEDIEGASRGKELTLRAIATSSFNSDDGGCYDSIFTAKEWTHLRYTFKRREIPRLSQHSVSSTAKQGLWSASTGSPEFEMNDWNNLYGYHSPQRYGHVETDLLPAITFSQAFQSSQNENKREPDSEVRSQINHSTAISSFSEVGYSSDEGSIIEVDFIPKKLYHGSLDDPIELISSQSSDLITTNLNPMKQAGEVKFKGPVKINEDSLNVISPRQKDLEEIPDSSEDEDDILHIIQVIRRDDDEVLEIPCSSDEGL